MVGLFNTVADWMCMIGLLLTIKTTHTHTYRQQQQLAKHSKTKPNERAIGGECENSTEYSPQGEGDGKCILRPQTTCSKECRKRPWSPLGSASNFRTQWLQWSEIQLAAAGAAAFYGNSLSCSHGLPCKPVFLPHQLCLLYFC